MMVEVMVEGISGVGCGGRGGRAWGSNSGRAGEGIVLRCRLPVR